DTKAKTAATAKNDTPKKDAEKKADAPVVEEEPAPKVDPAPMPPPMEDVAPPMPKVDPAPVPVPKLEDPAPKKVDPVDPATVDIVTLANGKTYRFDAARLQKGKTEIEYVEVDDAGKQVGRVKFAPIAGNTVKLRVEGDAALQIDPAFGSDLDLEVGLKGDKNKFSLDMTGYLGKHPKVNVPGKGTLQVVLSDSQLRGLDAGESQASSKGIHIKSGDQWINLGPDANVTLKSQGGGELTFEAGTGTASIRKGLAAFVKKELPEPKVVPKKVDEPAPKKVEPRAETALEKANAKIADLRGKIGERIAELPALEKTARPVILEKQKSDLNARLEALSLQQELIDRERGQQLSLTGGNALANANINNHYDQLRAASVLDATRTRANIRSVELAQRTAGEITPGASAAYESLVQKQMEILALNRALILANKEAEKARAEERRKAAPPPKGAVPGKKVGFNMEDGGKVADREVVRIDTKKQLVETMAEIAQQNDRTRG
ncbi:MAG: hypothetical protein EB060_01840, partial [Proteobacteria bacterium]|nr:hypothetical protein [Pseudomonadota bacterium]